MIDFSYQSIMFDELRHLLLIAEYGTFRAAATHAHLSQPALTASIRRLEERFGARLLHRGRRGAFPTAAGEALLPRAKAALAAVEDGRRAVAEVVGLQTGTVAMGAGATACTYLLPPLLAEFRALHPGIRLRLREAFTDELVAALHKGEVDLALVTGDGDDEWRDDELIIVAAPGLSPDSQQFVTFAPGSPTRALLIRHFPDIEIVMELGSIAAVKGHVRAGIGKALVSRAAVEMDLQAGRLVEIRSDRAPIIRRLSLIHRGIDRLPPAAGALRRLLLSR